MPHTPADPIRSWFTACEDLGEYIGIRFGRVAPGATQPEWFFLRHAEVDGIGGFARLLRQRGANLSRIPSVKHPAGPSAFGVVRALPKFFKPRHPLKWRSLQPRFNPDTKTAPPPAVAWHAFDEAETTQIRRVCRKAAYTVNSFLLKHLTKAVRPFLADESAVVPWMIPVNLRGKVARASDEDNHSSYVGVNIRSYETVHDVHQQIYRALGRGEHWANWSGYQLARVMTNGMCRALIKSGYATSQWNLGGFSNLGDWDSEKKITQTDCQGSWLFSPPVLRVQQVGAGCVTFQNRLSLVVQAHPDLTTDPAVPREWMHDWIKEIEIDIASVLNQVH